MPSRESRAGDIELFQSSSKAAIVEIVERGSAVYEFLYIVKWSRRRTIHNKSAVRTWRFPAWLRTQQAGERRPPAENGDNRYCNTETVVSRYSAQSAP